MHNAATNRSRTNACIIEKPKYRYDKALPALTLVSYHRCDPVLCQPALSVWVIIGEKEISIWSAALELHFFHVSCEPVHLVNTNETYHPSDPPILIKCLSDLAHVLYLSPILCTQNMHAHWLAHTLTAISGRSLYDTARQGQADVPLQYKLHHPVA